LSSFAKSSFASAATAGSVGNGDVYSIAANIRNVLFTPYVVTASIQNKLYVIDSISADIQNKLIDPLYVVSVAIRHVVYDLYSVQTDIRNVINHHVYSVKADIGNKLFTPYSISAAIQNRLQNPTMGAIWKAIITLNNVDMTVRQSGLVDVEMEEGAASVASFELLPFSGAIDPYEWIGVPVTIDYLTFNSAGDTLTNHRLFTGIVDEPIYDPATRFTRFECTDGLQEFFEQKSFAQVDAVIGGYHSDVVFGETEDRWEYAQQRLSTQPASFDFDVYGVGRLTNWQSKAVADLSFSAANIIHESLGLKLISRRDVVNTVNIKFGYRFGRKWLREIGGGWHYPRPFYQFLSDQTFLPNRDMVLNALNSGWDIKSISFNKLPPSGQYTNAEGGQTTWKITDELRDYLIFGASFTIAKRWLQDVTEDYTIQVTADASIAKHGVVKADEFYSLDEDVDEEFEQVSEQASVGFSSLGDSVDTGSSFGYTPPEFGGESVGDYDQIIDPISRVDVDNAIKTAIAEARTHILKTHRANAVIIQDLLVPSADTSKTAQVSTGEVAAKGKVKRVHHTLNTSSREALSTIELSLYQPNIAGQADDAVSVPAQINTSPSIQTKGLSLGSHFGGRTTEKYNPDWTGYIGNWTSARTFPSEWYPNEFRVDIPEIEDEARDAQEFTGASVYNTAIPQDILTINA